MSPLKIAELDLASVEPQVFVATVESLESKSTKFGKLMLVATLTDNTGFVQAAWFKPDRLANQLKLYDEYTFEGAIEFKYGSRQANNPSVRSADGSTTLHKAD